MHLTSRAARAVCAVCDRDARSEAICGHCGACRQCCPRWEWLEHALDADGDAIDDGVGMAAFAAMLRNPALYGPGDCLDVGDSLTAAFGREMDGGAA